MVWFPCSIFHFHKFIRISQIHQLCNHGKLFIRLKIYNKKTLKNYVQFMHILNKTSWYVFDLYIYITSHLEKEASPLSLKWKALNLIVAWAVQVRSLYLHKVTVLENSVERKPANSRDSLWMLCGCVITYQIKALACHISPVLSVWS